jgi:hypothetical protein
VKLQWLDGKGPNRSRRNAARKSGYPKATDGGGLRKENLLRTLKRVKSNKGSPGIDGMKVGELAGYLKQHWPAIR